MWTLKVCIGLIWGMCGHMQHLTYQTEAQCVKQQEIISTRKDVIYAVCIPGELK